MGKLQEFLAQNKVDNAVTTEVDIKPFPFPFVVKTITEAENKAIQKSCQITEFNKKPTAGKRRPTVRRTSRSWSSRVPLTPALRTRSFRRLTE